MSELIHLASPETPPTPSRESPRKMDMSKVTGPILLHLLGTEVRVPRLFLLRCRLTLGRFKKTIDPRFQPDLIELAALPLWVYLNLKRKIGQTKAYEIMRVAILTGGIAQWNLAYRAAVNKRTFDNLCDAEIDVNQTGPTKWNTMVVVERTARRFEIKITRCMYHELTTHLGIPELTTVVCQIDNAAFNSYLPDTVVFSRGDLVTASLTGKRNAISYGTCASRLAHDLR